MIEAQRLQYGGIDCIVVDGGPSPSIPVIMCHGYGASGMDLAGLSAEWIHLIGDAASSLRFVFPEAPYTLEAEGMPDGHAWWPINMMRMMELIQAERVDQLQGEEPPGISQATEEICGTIHAVKEDLGGAPTSWVLGGFSQGAMLAMNASLRGDFAAPSLLFQFSSNLICKPQWESELSKLKRTRVFQSHGTFDPILPFSGAQALHELLRRGEIAADFHSFPGPHTIDAESITITGQMLASLG